MSFHALTVSTYRKALFIGLWVETLLYGAYAALFSLCIYTIRGRRKLKNAILIMTAVALFASSTAHLITIFIATFDVVLDPQNRDASEPVAVATLYLYVTNNIIADSLIFGGLIRSSLSFQVYSSAPQQCSVMLMGYQGINWPISFHKHCSDVSDSREDMVDCSPCSESFGSKARSEVHLCFFDCCRIRRYLLNFADNLPDCYASRATTSKRGPYQDHSIPYIRAPICCPS